jgi:toxin HigB-1
MKDEAIEKIFTANFLSRQLPQDMQRVTARKLAQLHAATILNNRWVPPGNQLEALIYDRPREHRICANDQWRVCFMGRDGNAFDAEMVDYDDGKIMTWRGATTLATTQATARHSIQSRSMWL